MSLFVQRARQNAAVNAGWRFHLQLGERQPGLFSQKNTTGALGLVRLVHTAYPDTKFPTKPATTKPTTPIKTGLEGVPNKHLIRSLLVSSVSFIPNPLLGGLIRFMKRHSWWFDLPPLRTLMQRTFYDTFCIGATKREIASNVSALRTMGFRGVILAFGREAMNLAKKGGDPQLRLTRADPELDAFVQFNLDTIDRLSPGDYLAVRCTGAGRTTIRVMDDFAATCKDTENPRRHEEANSELDVFRDALYDICMASQARGIKVLIDAEDTERQLAIDHVALHLMKIFNTGKHATILNTYQMYLKSGIEKLRSHLNHSVQKNYILGVKMVRGAFITTEPSRFKVHDTKQDTDAAYNEAVELLIRGRGAGALEGTSGRNVSSSTDSHPRWAVDVMLATHNANSAREALRLYQELIQSGASKSAPGIGLQSLTFAQLKGMADELSFELTSRIEEMHTTQMRDRGTVASNDGRYPSIGVYKYSVWGTLQECLLYMLRRAEENKDAVERTKETAVMTAKELLQRVTPFRKAWLNGRTSG